MRFHAEVLLGGKTATGIRVPPEVVEALGASKRPAVSVTINGYTYRSTVAVMGGEFMLPLSAEHRGGAGVGLRCGAGAVPTGLEFEHIERVDGRGRGAVLGWRAGVRGDLGEEASECHDEGNTAAIESGM